MTKSSKADALVCSTDEEARCEMRTKQSKAWTEPHTRMRTDFLSEDSKNIKSNKTSSVEGTVVKESEDTTHPIELRLTQKHEKSIPSRRLGSMFAFGFVGGWGTNAPFLLLTLPFLSCCI